MGDVRGGLGTGGGGGGRGYERKAAVNCSTILGKGICSCLAARCSEDNGGWLWALIVFLCCQTQQNA